MDLHQGKSVGQTKAKKRVGGTAKPIARRPGATKPKAKVGGTAKPIAKKAGSAVTAGTKTTPSPKADSTIDTSPEKAERRAAPAKGMPGWLVPLVVLIVLVFGVGGWMLTQSGAGGAVAANGTSGGAGSGDEADSGGGADTGQGVDTGGANSGGGDAQTGNAGSGATQVTSSGSMEAGVVTEKIKKELYRSPYEVVCAPDGKSLFVANHTALELAVVDAASGKISKQLEMKGRPAGLAMSADGSQLYVACAAPNGSVVRVNTAKGEITGTVAVGHTPTGLVLSKDGKWLYCCNRFCGTISVIDAGTVKEARRIKVAREPFDAVVSADGKTLFVAHHLPLGPATGDYVGAAVSVIDLASDKVSLISLPNGTTGVRGICLSPDGAFVYVTHILAHYQLPTTQLERGWMNTNAMSIVKTTDRSLLNTVLLDDVDLGAANPWGIACSPDGKWLYVAHSGTHELSIVDRKALHDRLAQVASGKKVATSSSAADVPLDLAFLVGLRRRIRLKGNGPRGLCVCGNKVFVAEYFSDSLSVVDVSKDTPSVQALKLGDEVKLTELRRGEMLFNDATACFQNWQSCASCHPDSRSDGLNWDLLNDGIGNPKNSRSMVLSHKTPPVMSLAVRSEAKVAVRAGFKHIQFALRGEGDLIAVDKYLTSLLPVPSPALVDGKLSPSAQRGLKIFDKAGCRECHDKPYYTSLGSYHLGHGTGQDTEKPFDTPTLLEAWRTGPYLFDGRAATLEEVFTKWNKKDKHGKTSELSPEELKDLVEYIRSL